MKQGPGRFQRAAAVTLAALLFAALSAPFPQANAASTILLTGDELEQVRHNIQQEPLKSYFDRLQRGDGGSAAPFLHLLTGERRYAEASRRIILSDLDYLRDQIPYMVNIWILRPPGRVVSAIMAWDMTKDSGVYSDEDRRAIEETLSWTIDHFMNEGADHIGAGFQYITDYLPWDMEDWVIANMNIHRLEAVALYALAFPESPRSEALLEYTADYYERVLSLGSRPGGAWAENPRYMGGILRKLFIIAAGLKKAGVHDFFADERLRVMLSFFAESIPAPGIDDPNRPLMVAADDAHWWENRSTILSWAAPRYRDSEPQAAGEWMWCWKNQDAPLSHESLFFVDPSIQPVKPSYGSYLPGMGYVLLRERFAEPDETFFFATFGPELGTANRTMHHAPNHGDFSIIWRGEPLFLTRGCASYVWSRRMRDQVDFARNLVTFEGAGSSIEIPEKRYSGEAVEVNTGFDETLARDYYPDGVANFVSADSFEYAAGRVRNWQMSLPAPFNNRHFLFLKPDVFIVWDQVRSPYPLQWNFHMPADDVTVDGKRITLAGHGGVKLAIDFLQDERLDCQLDWPMDSIRTKWPMVLSCPWGEGMFVFNAMDIARQVLEHNNPGAAKILENILCHPARPKRIGLIGTDGQTAEVLDRFGMNYELLSYDDMAGDLSRFDRIILGHFGVLVRDRDMLDYRRKLWDYVENGGVCYWAYQYAWGWKPGDTSGPGYFPRMLMVGEGTSALWGEGIELDCPVFTDGSPLWNEPNRITENDWDGWQVGAPDTLKLLHYNQIPNTDRARNIPVYYSDYWQVHASAKRTYNINLPRTRERFGPYRWIKVYHEPSDDYLAVLRPWKDGSAPAAEIIRGHEDEVVIRQGNDIWWALLGKHAGLTGTLALMRYDDGQLRMARTEDGGVDVYDQQRFGVEPRELMLVDNLDAELGGMVFTFEQPATFHIDFGTKAGSLAVPDEGSVTLPWGFERVTLDGRRMRAENDGGFTSFELPAGDYSFDAAGETLALTRNAHVARLEVFDGTGQPVEWVHIFRTLSGDGRTWFQGATDGDGTLSIRWEGNDEQELIFEKDGKHITRTVRPGVQRVEFR